MKSGPSVQWYFSPGPAPCAMWAGPPGCPEAGSGRHRPQGRFAPRKCAVASKERGHPTGQARGQALDRGDARCLAMFRPGRGNATPTEPENIDGDRVLANASATTNGAHLLRRTCGRGMPLAATWGSAAESWECLVFVSQGWGSVQFLIRVICDLICVICVNFDCLLPCPPGQPIQAATKSRETIS